MTSKNATLIMCFLWCSPYAHTSCLLLTMGIPIYQVILFLPIRLLTRLYGLGTNWDYVFLTSGVKLLLLINLIFVHSSLVIFDMEPANTEWVLLILLPLLFSLHMTHFTKNTFRVFTPEECYALVLLRSCFPLVCGHDFQCHKGTITSLAITVIYAPKI